MLAIKALTKGKWRRKIIKSTVSKMGFLFWPEIDLFFFQGQNPNITPNLHNSIDQPILSFHSECTLTLNADKFQIESCDTFKNEINTYNLLDVQRIYICVWVVSTYISVCEYLLGSVQRHDHGTSINKEDPRIFAFVGNNSTTCRVLNVL